MPEGSEIDATGPASNPLEGEQEEEAEKPSQQNADCLQSQGLALCDYTSDHCFAVERRTIARPTFSMPATARLQLLAEVIGNPSGLLECQWKIVDVVAESVNALEQRLLQIPDATSRDISEDGTDSTGSFRFTEEEYV